MKKMGQLSFKEIWIQLLNGKEVAFFIIALVLFPPSRIVTFKGKDLSALNFFVTYIQLWQAIIHKLN